MSAIVLVCGRMFDGNSEELAGPTEILVEGNRVSWVGRTLGRPADAHVIDLSDRTVSPGFIDTHVHLTMGQIWRSKRSNLQPARRSKA
jgi:imidazolonepropionase-like amidohydrolase